MRRLIVTIAALALVVVAGSVTAEPVWVQSCTLGSRGHVMVDNTGSIYAIGGDMSLSKFDAAGTLLWTQPGPGSAGFNSSTRDVQGNFYLCGVRYVSGDTTDILVVSFSPSGTLRWQQTYNGPANLTDKAGAITVAGDRVVIVGTVAANGPGAFVGSDIVTLCYTTSGALLWAKQHGYAEGDLWFKGGTGAAIDAEGNAYAAGFVNSPSSDEIVLLKYSPAGDVVWEQFVDLYTSAARVMPDRAGNLVVAATSGQADRDVFLAKFAPDGTKLWQASYDGPSKDSATGGDDRLATLVTGNANEIYVAASTGQGYGWGWPDITLLKYSSDGTREWVRKAGGSALDEAGGLAITPTGNPVITGSMEVGFTNDYVGIIGEYTSAGDIVLLDTLSGVSGIRDIGIDPTGAAIVSDRSTKLAKYQVSCCVGGTGDLNVSGRIDLTDLSIMLAYLLGSGPVRMCPEKADLNGQDGIDLIDLSALITYLLVAGVKLPACP